MQMWLAWTRLVPVNMVKCSLDIFERLRQQSLLKRVKSENVWAGRLRVFIYTI